jgi:hypothetical protein
MPPQITETTATPDEFAIAQAEAEKDNASRSGIGTRLKVGRTRGKGSIVIKYENFDESQPDTLPKSIEQFMEVTGVKSEPDLVNLLIAGHNEALYTAASDPLAEFVEETWPTEVKTQFRLVVRNYSRGASVSLDDAVELIKPGFVKQFGPK